MALARPLDNMTVIGQTMQEACFVLRAKSIDGSVLMRGCEEEVRNRQPLTRVGVEQVQRPSILFTSMTTGPGSFRG